MTCQASERLKEMLHRWKMEWWIYELSVRIKFRHDRDVLERRLAKVPKWRQYEHVVLDNKIRDVDWGHFAGSDEAFGEMPWLQSASSFPTELFYWNRESRRVYILPKELQDKFVEGTYPNLQWPDFKWPLDYFLLTLEQPLLAEDRVGVWVKYDTIFVSRHSDGKNEQVSMRILREPTKHADTSRYVPKFTAADKLVTRGEYDRALQMYRRGVKNYDKENPTRQGWREIPLYQNIIGPVDPAMRIAPTDFLGMVQRDHPSHVSFSEADFEEHAERMSIFAKMVVGTCLFINTFTSPPSPRPIKRPPGNRGVTGIITDADHICDVIGKGVIDPVVFGIREPRERASPMFVRPHARRGFWRREAGSPPNAPKTIWVPKTIVRKDLIPEYGLMSGTETLIKPDE